MLRLETSRLELRSFQAEDAEALFELDHDRRVIEFLGPRMFDNVAAYRQRIVEVYAPYAERLDGLGLWAVWEKGTNQFLGWCCLRPAGDYRFAAEAGFRASDAELGYRLKSSAWGKGMATEASQGLIRDLIRRDFQGEIVATALAANHRSIRVMQKCGLKFVREFQLPGFEQPSVCYALESKDFSSS